MASKPVVAWIGAGRMGVPMAGFVLKAGYAVKVYSRSSASRQKLVSQGAQEALSAADSVRDAGVVFTSLADDGALRATVLGEGGALVNMRPNSVLAETSTVSTRLSEEIDAAARARGIAYLRVPISGNAASAQKGEVTALVSGPRDAWERIKPIVESFSKGQIYLGPGEQARVMKLVVNALVVNFAQAMAEALALGRKGGLEWDLMLDTLAQSTLSSPWLKVKAQLLKQRDFTTTMSTRLILKDIDLMLDAARGDDLPMPLTALTRQLLQVVVGEGYGEDDYMCAVKVAEKQAGLPTDHV
ncbi:MAG TPA: NAD(P)-dependent oxidoreductase [Burkholderiales bacterium]|nr:NAD(P)-dependent oxidoreductase [Burkholderiales bacterium]